MLRVIENFAVIHGHSRSFEFTYIHTPLSRACVSCYSSSIVSMLMSCIVLEIKRNIGRKSRFFIPLLYNNHLSLLWIKYLLKFSVPRLKTLIVIFTTWGNCRNYSQTGTLHHRHGQLDVCEQAQVKYYGQDGAAVGWNKIIFVNSDASGGRLTLIRRRHSFTPSWCRVSIIAMQSSPRLRRQQQTGYNEC